MGPTLRRVLAAVAAVIACNCQPPGARTGGPPGTVATAEPAAPAFTTPPSTGPLSSSAEALPAPGAVLDREPRGDSSCFEPFVSRWSLRDGTDGDLSKLSAVAWLDGSPDHGAPLVQANDPRVAAARCVATGPHRGLNLRNWCCRPQPTEVTVLAPAGGTGLLATLATGRSVVPAGRDLVVAVAIENRGAKPVDLDLQVASSPQLLLEVRSLGGQPMATVPPPTPSNTPELLSLPPGGGRTWQHRLGVFSPPLPRGRYLLRVRAPGIVSGTLPFEIADAAPSVGTAPAPAGAKAPEGMALVGAGPFVMGADEGGEPDEHPAHRVTLEAFWLDVTEVTNEAYAECVGEGVCRPKDGRVGVYNRPRQPVTGVSWEDARTYCQWRGKRLPTEAEFEKAVRSGDGRRFPWGNEEPTLERTVALGQAGPEEVGSRPAGRGPYGHDDLAGNVWEWVADLYDPFAYRREGAARGVHGSCAEIEEALEQIRRKQMTGFTGTNPITGCERSIRGGAYNYPAAGLRSSNRIHHPGSWRLRMTGFRCAT